MSESENKNKDGVAQDAKQLAQKVDKAAHSEDDKAAQARARAITSNAAGLALVLMLLVFGQDLAQILSKGDIGAQERYLFIIRFAGIVLLIGALAQVSSSYLAGRFAKSRSREATEISESELRKLLDLGDLESEDLAPDYLASGENEEQRSFNSRMYHIRRSVDVVRKRLRTEIGDLGRRGNLNLVIGFTTSVSAVGLLAYVSFSASTTAQDWHDQIPIYVLRISVAFFIEIFSFFFLRLYRANLQEIKYFQNELTNIEARAIALEVALVVDDKDSAKALISELARTERNFVLKKGESTTELELAKAESRGWRDATAAVGKLIRPERSEQK